MAARYLPQDDRIGLLLVQLGLCPTPDDRADLFINACIEAGGSVILPGMGRDTHLAEVSLFDLCGRGQTMTMAIAAAMSDATGEVITPKEVSDLLDSWHRHAVGRRARLVLRLDMRARRFRVGNASGATFDDVDDFDGLTLTIEVFSVSEARAVLKAITKTVAQQT